MRIRSLASRVSACFAVTALIVIAMPFTPRLHATFAQDAPGKAAESNVRIGVMGLFHPTEFRLSATTKEALVIEANDRRVILEASSGLDSATVQMSGSRIILTAGQRVERSSTIVVAGRTGEPVDFVLAIPGKITRRYHGRLTITPSDTSLIGIVTMDRELAVASVVAAESDSNTPSEALKAQAVAARSYLTSARGRHSGFDFCDTTHCQFLREPPLSGTLVVDAVTATRGLVLTHNAKPFAAMYTRSCSGQTHTPAQLGLPSPEYPYYSVDCAYCRSYPERWATRISRNDAASLRPSDEATRLKIDRRLGWGAVPSNDFHATTQGDHLVLTGTGHGHGIGLCQSGAKAMAREGANFQEILLHYYPNTAILNTCMAFTARACDHAVQQWKEGEL